ncbi:SPOR domain-containing protein [Thalassobellus suaedae]|uniref:SPOR domain-containing protein n=1 Tax=Thalassobellus suaedae TaxID=3074124 RepID=A0ABY9XRM3_9FLAO|nr:SPOR domain-containing protein [Flavobacteriaceae bacterium HL-DH14]
MQLETYISDLLYRYECVTIPEFGTFLTQPVSATVNNTTNVFYPPKKVVSFNEQIQKNDGLLVNYIADVEKIPFEIANEKIAKRVTILKDFLTQGETLTFKNIGEIVFNSEGKILFEPSYHLNYLTDAFGLSQFVSPSITRETYKEEVEAIEKVIPITITPEKRKSRPYFKYAAVALIALTLGGFAASKYYVNQIEAHNQLAQEEAEQKLDNKIQQATFNLNPFPAITLKVTKQAGSFHIVAGAFRIEENCDKKIDQLKADGFKARKIGVNKYGLHQVVYASYENRLEALKALRNIKKTHNKDAWLLVDSDTKIINTLSKVNAANEQSLQTAETKESTDLANQQPLSNSPETADNFELEENPNVIKIIHNVKTVESGYYLMLGAYNNSEKRDAFLSELTSAELSNISFFFDTKNAMYFVYYKEKFNDLESANKSLQSKGNLSYTGKMAVVKVEN